MGRRGSSAAAAADRDVGGATSGEATSGATASESAVGGAAASGE